jgi:hypothetical protein
MRWREMRGQRQWVLAARGAAGSAAKAMPVNSAARMGSCRSWQGRGAWTMDFSRPGAAGASSRARPWQPPARARTRGARAWRLGRAPARAPASPPRGRGHAGARAWRLGRAPARGPGSPRPRGTGPGQQGRAPARGPASPPRGRGLAGARAWRLGRAPARGAGSGFGSEGNASAFGSAYWFMQVMAWARGLDNGLFKAAKHSYLGSGMCMAHTLMLARFTCCEF